jgi:transposase
MQTDAHGSLWGFVDWATESHSVCVVDGQGNAVAEFAVENTPAGLAKLATKLTELGQGYRGGMSIAIEVPHGPVVDALLESGFALFTLNPKQIDRFRDRYTMAGAKDDRRDAFVGSNALRTDPQAFRRIDPDHPAVIELREWSRIDRELGQELVAQANRLREQVLRVAPHWLALCTAADEPWFWALLELAPTPRDAAALRVKRVQAVLRSHRIRRVSAPQVHGTWQSACLGTPLGVVTAVGAHVRVLLAQLRLLHTQRRQSAAELERCLEGCRSVFVSPPGRPSDVEIVLSQPGIGLRVAACLLGEAGRCLRERNLRAFRAQTGTSPVTKQSGKTRQVVMRHACHLRLRDACYHWARGAVINDPRSKEHYAALKRKGHGHARALRGVADRMAGRLFVMLDRGTLYDPHHRRLPAGHKQA